MTENAPTGGSDLDRARAVAAAVPDPEVPVLTVEDLGILRAVDIVDGRVRVTVTPTYSGCPAVEAIAREITARLVTAGFADCEVATTLTPAWSTAWMSQEGRRKLEAFGIAPPTGRDAGSGGARGAVPLTLSVRCTRCGSRRTRELSRFGSTACKSLWVCSDCAEPFDHFKDF